MNAKSLATHIRYNRNVKGPAADQMRELLDELDDLAAQEEAEWEEERKLRKAARDAE